MPSWCARRKERSALRGVVSGLRPCSIGRERPRHDIALGVQTRIRKLGDRVIVFVEKIVDLNAKLQPFSGS